MRRWLIILLSVLTILIILSFLVIWFNESEHKYYYIQKNDTFDVFILGSESTKEVNRDMGLKVDVYFRKNNGSYKKLGKTKVYIDQGGQYVVKIKKIKLLYIEKTNK